VLALLGAACSQDANAPADSSQFALAASFANVPTGFDNTSNSFAAGDIGAPWMPHRGPDRGMGLDGGLMGGGVEVEFLGGLGFGRGRGFGPFHPFNGFGPPCNGVFSAATGRVTCDPITRDGITITRSFAYTTAAGVAQPAFDDQTTNTITSRPPSPAPGHAGVTSTTMTTTA
jgi:hypothetical protein